ncbi:MAG: hypothetical protein RLZZ293_1484 [Pseudomonadota bacterium]|jgi:alpha-mannosidase
MYHELKKTYIDKINKFRNVLAKQRFGETIIMSARYAQTHQPVEFGKHFELDYQAIKQGDSWGKVGEQAWFHIKTTIPAHWQQQAVVARIQLNSEILLFNSQGLPIFALTNASVWDKGFIKDRYIVSEQAQGGEVIEFWLDAVCIGETDIGNDSSAETLNQDLVGVFNGQVHDLKLSIWYPQVHDLLIDIEVLSNLLTNLTENSPRRNRILRGLNQAINCYAENPINANSARQILSRLINNQANQSSLTAYAVGHAHLDTGWLWPIQASIGKTARTFAYQTYLLDKYPEYVFGASQPQHFKFIQDHYPQLFNKIHQLVQQGRFELQGAMWVEADCNLISGESMIRQIMYGKNYFKREFAVEVTNLWLPDVFGYSANLPQILRKSNVNYFMTQKISWNQFNTFPHHTFIWRGIDGSEILSHFLPANTYNGKVKPEELIAGEARFSENGIADEFLYLFGIGDGGGGPSEEHLEQALRLRNTEGCPSVKLTSANEFFIQQDKYHDQLERWVGELYLELHRGTLTTQAKIKQYNRYLENYLRSLEAACSTLELNDYPHQLFQQIYPLILINQFHDIIPGSSINQVYQEAIGFYQQALDLSTHIVDLIKHKLAQNCQGKLAWFNASGFNYSHPLKLAKKFKHYSFFQDKIKLSTQELDDGVWVTLAKEIDPYSWLNLEYTIEEAKINQDLVPKTLQLIIENKLVRYEFNHYGQIISAYDKQANQEFLAQGNIFQLYIDRPFYWDAWDIDYDYQEMCIATLHAHQIDYFSGEVCHGLRLEYKIGNSTLWQEISLAHNSKQLNFNTRVNWQEQHKMLRVSFITKLINPRANFDIQYGYVERPTHRNTSWDLAQFESVAQKYVDLATADYGVALLNDCKYGHKVFDQTIDLNLLRSATKPDPLADIGEHNFNYAIYPHLGDLAHSDVYIHASQFNHQALILTDCQINLQLPFMIKQNNGISLEVVKHAEDAKSLVIRLVEYRGRTGQIELEFNQAITIAETNLIEWIDQHSVITNQLQLNFTPFEIKTFKLFV